MASGREVPGFGAERLPLSGRWRAVPQAATEREVDMSREMVLLRAVEGTREGWLVMERDEFLEQMDLNVWKAEQVLVGIVLPAGPPRQAN